MIFGGHFTFFQARLLPPAPILGPFYFFPSKATSSRPHFTFFQARLLPPAPILAFFSKIPAFGLHFPEISAKMGLWRAFRPLSGPSWALQEGPKGPQGWTMRVGRWVLGPFGPFTPPPHPQATHLAVCPRKGLRPFLTHTFRCVSSRQAGLPACRIAGAPAPLVHQRNKITPKGVILLFIIFKKHP